MAFWVVVCCVVLRCDVVRFELLFRMVLAFIVLCRLRFVALCCFVLLLCVAVLSLMGCVLCCAVAVYFVV